MGRARYLVDAVLFGGRSPTELARAHGLSRSWIYKLVARYRQGGYEALEPKSHRPRSCPNQVGAEVQQAILQLRAELATAGHDAGAQTIAHHLVGRVEQVPSVATVWRILSRAGLITPQPHKRPRSSFTRFEASLPNQMWQMDATHWRLADGTPVEILNLLDDNSRLCPASVALPTVKAADVVQAFYTATDRFGFPASLLCDNAAVFSGKSRRGKVFLESELERLGIVCKHSSPYHPQTCGKVERFHQTLKRFLARQAPPTSLALLQAQLDAFRAYYNQQRPHRALPGLTPLTVFTARVKAGPASASPPVHFRVRHDTVDPSGTVTLRHFSRLYHIGLGRAFKHQAVRIFVADRHIRIVREDGLLLRDLTLDPSRDYQPLNSPQVSTMS
jgi:transposase InsO family protein